MLTVTYPLFLQAVKTIMRPATSKPHEVIDEFLQKCANTGQANEQADKYILKISGKEEYLLGKYPLCQYQVCKESDRLVDIVFTSIFREI